MTERDYIGPDPVAWVERLIEVNKGSQFTQDQKTSIGNALHWLRKSLKIKRRADGE